MKHAKIFLSLLIVAVLAIGFFAGCGEDTTTTSSNVGSVTGTVTATNGQPIQGATCSINTTSAKTTYSDDTDENGDFVILDVPEGTWTLTITKTGYQTLTISNVSVYGGTETKIPASQTVMSQSGYGNVSGKVTSETETGPVISGAYVAIGSISTTSDSTGFYQLTNVPSGLQTITAVASEFIEYSSTVTVIANTTVTKNIIMFPGGLVTPTPTPSPNKGHIVGKVVDGNGAPLYGVSVTDGFSVVTTDTSGKYILLNLDPGVVTLQYAKTGYTSKSQQVTVIADSIVTAPTITMTTLSQ